MKSVKYMYCNVKSMGHCNSNSNVLFDNFMRTVCYSPHDYSYNTYFRLKIINIAMNTVRAECISFPHFC